MKEYAILTRPYGPPTEPVEVRILARVDGYSMVRRRGCMPFVVFDKWLGPVYIKSSKPKPRTAK